MNLSGKRIRGLLALGGLVIVVVVALLASRGHSTQSSSNSVTGSKASVTTTTSVVASEPGRAPGVPDHAYRTLREIDAGRWPDSADAPGTKGGDQWMNRGGSLPRTDSSGKQITYREWDVNPKKPGRSRDAERIVTGSDGSAYYTGDHYKTFTRMR
ncbi:ribonuclease domain-containing protein [Nocardia transvalensis]|uniref:ribonuclease domain-containing protein n=1 Tax=Nocardia transvalensis TaxID=37333 RepID=UPI0018937DD1|nr:ribonuclease domain-containing protein [Nocardia transvalensis]MBF6327379.1 ribonuclease [Nocardia transvalensis]